MLTGDVLGNQCQRNIYRHESLFEAYGGYSGVISHHNQYDFDGSSGRSTWNELVFSS